MINKWICLFFITYASAFLFSCGGNNSQTEVDGSEQDSHIDGHSDDAHVILTDEALKTLNLRTEVAGKRPIESEIKTTAVIEPNRTKIAHVSPRISGRVVDVKAVLGDRVQMGEILAELDSIELGQTKAEYLKSKANLEVALANYSRESRLYKKQITSEKDYLFAKAEYIQAESALNKAVETLRLLGLSDEEIKALKWGNNDQPSSIFPLRAPFTGTVVEQHIVLGEFIKPEERPYTIADLSHLWIQLDIFEKDLKWVDDDKAVNIKVNAYPDEVFKGKVTYISDILDESTRTAKARVEILNPDGKLKPGMFASASISIPSQDSKEYVVIPSTAIQQIEGETVVFIQEDENSFEMKEVTIGNKTGDYVQILKGIDPGDRVVIEGGFYLKSSLLKDEMGEGHAH